MENKHLIDLSIKYGLNSADLSKLVSIVHQAGVYDADSDQFQKITDHLCSENMLEIPAEEIIEELKLKGLITD